MGNTYSSAPIISHDAEFEGVRAEVKVVRGVGIVDSIEPSKSGKAVKVSFSVSNSDYLPSGSVPLAQEKVVDFVKQAHESKEPIAFRIETRRQKHIDRTVPIADISTLAVAAKSIHKSLAAVGPEDGELIFSDFAVTDPAEDPADNNSGIHSALGKVNKPVNKASSASNNNSSVEPAPYVTWLDEGVVNPGSFAVVGPLAMHSYINDYMRDRNIEGIPKSIVMKLALTMMEAASELQVAFWGDELEGPDLGAASHTRARSIIFEIARTDYPLELEALRDADDEGLQSLLAEWKASTVRRGLKLWQWATRTVKHIEG